MQAKRVRLAEGVVLRKLTRWERYEIVEGCFLDAVKAGWTEKHDFVVDSAETTLGRSEHPNESLLSCLRLLKPGRVTGGELVEVDPGYRDREISVHQGLAPADIYTSTFDYHLAASEVGALLSIWALYHKARRKGHRWFDEAVDRFNFSYDRLDQWDRLLELMISVEAVVGRPFSANLAGQPWGRTLHTVSCASALISNSKDEVDLVSKDFAEAYRVRSQAVHGWRQLDTGRDERPSDEIGKLVDKVEGYCRRLIMKAARVIAEGKAKDFKKRLSERLPLKNSAELYQMLSPMVEEP